MIAGTVLQRSIYAQAAIELAQADARDGDAQLESAEASLYAGAKKAAIVSRIIAGLRLAPSSARGWLLLSEVTERTQPALAGAALSQSFLLAPYDFYLAGRRANDAAKQWATLDPETRSMAQRQTERLWDEGDLRGYIRPLLTSDAGTALVNRSFASRRTDQRLINRWLEVQRLRYPSVVRPWQ